ncbi:MAG TPA: transporter substrate-binding domain-containing protein [Alphaproteobacteria bacterium]|nr:transporter substrate-binding domain-containing protein [Alphaproteobacteria bacterium]
MPLARCLRHAALALGLALSLALLAAGPARAQPIPVAVGGYDFPPYVDEKGGLVHDLIALFNDAQSRYRFAFVGTTPQRRYQDMAEGRIDLIAFESLDWGWAGRPVEATAVFLEDAEVFVARAAPGRGQAYFDNLAGKTLLGRLGYHYAFADYDADPDSLARRFNMRVTKSHEGNLLAVIAGRADLAIVTRSFLATWLKSRTGVAKDLLISDRVDQTYRHTIVVRRGSPVDVATLDALLAELRADGRLDALWARAGLTR